MNDAETIANQWERVDTQWGLIASQWISISKERGEIAAAWREIARWRDAESDADQAEPAASTEIADALCEIFHATVENEIPIGLELHSRVANLLVRLGKVPAS